MIGDVRLGGQELHEGRYIVIGREGGRTGRDLEEGDTEGPNVGAPIEGRAARVLRRHVADLAAEHAVGGLGGEAAARLGDPEIDDLHAARDAHEEVVRRNVTMHDLERSPVVGARLVDRVKAVACLHADAKDDPEWQVAGALREGAQREPFDPFHREIRHAVLFTGVVELDQVRVAHGACDARLLDEELGELAAALRRDDGLDRDETTARARVTRRPDGAHAAASDLSLEPETTDRRTGPELCHHSEDTCAAATNQRRSRVPCVRPRRRIPFSTDT